MSIGVQQQLLPRETMELVTNAYPGLVIVVSITVCSSSIPEYLSKIKITVGSLLDNEMFRNINKGKDLTLFKRIERKKVIYMSAYDMVYFKKSFLLSAFGVLFSYGLLVVNLNLNRKNE
ncbi:uncharacterized protein TNCT_193671 [Trichonephila clavata]|uniref:Uncharacterized protein n=1 Tax=Trichonephila clavata TaxID=2740835 RepID=A0A8X6ITY4_TRICU|nr:uncharacterized protein TNCT_193671 [Trichonephila clavata]